MSEADHGAFFGLTRHASLRELEQLAHQGFLRTEGERVAGGRLDLPAGPAEVDRCLEVVRDMVVQELAAIDPPVAEAPGGRSGWHDGSPTAGTRTASQHRPRSRGDGVSAKEILRAILDRLPSRTEPGGQELA